MFISLGVTLAASSTKATPTTPRPKSWFNFWDFPAVQGNTQSSGTFTPGPQAGAGNIRQGTGVGAAQQGNAGQSNSGGLFQWFQNSAVDPLGTDSSTPPNAVNPDVWANPDNQHNGGGRYFRPDGGYSPDFTAEQHHSGENHGTNGPMAGPGGRNNGMAMAGGAGGNHNVARGNPNAAGGSPNLPLQSPNEARSVGSGAAAGTLVGVAVAIVVLVAIFAGAAYVVTRQRRNNRVILASV